MLPYPIVSLNQRENIMTMYDDKVDRSASAKFQRIYDAMAFAQSRGIKKPKIKLGNYKVSLVTDGFNAGGLYVFHNGTYIGKVKGDTFYQSNGIEIVLEIYEQITSLLSDPKTYAVAYGQRTGECAICGRELTNKESIKYGIGPICMEKLGWLPDTISDDDSGLLDYL